MLIQMMLMIAAQSPVATSGPDAVPAPVVEPRCLPGAQMACACLVGGQGIQVCEASGLSLGPCVCPQAVPAEPGAPVLSSGAPRVQVVDKGPPELSYKGEVPGGYSLQTRARPGWVEAGLGTTAAVYLTGGAIASLIDAAGGNETSHRWLYLPLFGPLIAAGTPERGEADTFTFILIVDAVLQIAGVGAAIYAVASPESYLLRDDLAIAPFVAEDQAGLMVSGTLW